MINKNKPNIDELYPNYSKLVIGNCRPFLKKLPGEELEDLSQSAWEQIVRKYDGFDPAKSVLSTWIVIVTKSTMYDMIRANQRDKRAIQNYLVSFESLTNGKDKYL